MPPCRLSKSEDGGTSVLVGLLLEILEVSLVFPPCPSSSFRSLHCSTMPPQPSHCAPYSSKTNAETKTVGGDSGAWIISNTTGQVAGHVLAERNGLTYFCSMALLFEDIRYTLGAKWIGLPGPKCELQKLKQRDDKMAGQELKEREGQRGASMEKNDKGEGQTQKEGKVTVKTLPVREKIVRVDVGKSKVGATTGRRSGFGWFAQGVGN